MKHRIAAVLAYIFCLQMLAQPKCDLVISGRVVDEHDGSALSFAEVYIENTSIATTSDAAGYYTLEGVCAGSWVIVCKHLGCLPIKDTLQIEADLTHDFFPEHHAELLKTISIEARRTSENTVTSVSEVKDLQHKSGQTLGEMVEGITGVSTLNTGGSISKPVVHGLHSNRVLIMNNGVRQEGQQWGAEHAPEIDPSAAGQIQVVKGARSIEFGPEAIGGVVLMKPHELPEGYGLGGNVQATGQSNGRGGVISSMLEGRHESIKAFRWRVQGSLKKLGNQHAPTYFLKNTGVEEWNFSTAVSLSDSNKGVEFYYSQFNTNLGIFSASHIGNLTDLKRAFEASEPLEKANFEFKIDRPYQHVEHEMAKLTAYWKTRSLNELRLVYGRQYNLREEYDKHRGADSTRPGLQFEIITHSLDLSYFQTTWGNHRLKFGASVLAQENTSEGRFFIPNFHKWMGGVYVIDQWRHSSGWLLEAGGRIDYLFQRFYFSSAESVQSSDREYLQPSFTIGTAKQVNNHWQWKASLASAWRPPSANELYSNGLHHGAATFEIGDANLLSEVSYSASTSLKAVYEKLQIETEVYINYMDDFIYLAPKFPATLTIRGAFPTFSYQQTDALLYGLDHSVSYRLTPYLTILSSTALLRARDLVTKSWLPQMPADQSTLALKFDKRLRNLKCFVQPEAKWVNKQWRVPANSDYVAPPEAYIVTNLQLGVSNEKGRSGTYFTVIVNNLFNQRYRSYLNRYRYFADEVGRNIVVRLTQNF